MYSQLKLSLVCSISLFGLFLESFDFLWLLIDCYLGCNFLLKNITTVPFHSIRHGALRVTRLTKFWFQHIIKLPLQHKKIGNSNFWIFFFVYSDWFKIEKYNPFFGGWATLFTDDKKIWHSCVVKPDGDEPTSQHVIIINSTKFGVKI
jgi:hypothetical protein